ncbi:uncharacterized protein LOC122296681 [Carya illinoinensis]|uniref:uncharacterized protein LOC122296681 n=1 Tax=Carya illinoinensis TaxID=32201 RepID=UPI001C71A7B7|nr:uncharacterized protein LOC122296681 [Carya illinoinensis]
MNVLEEKWKKFRLSEGEATNIIFEEEEAEGLQFKEDWSLVCKACSMRTISKVVLESTMAKVWRISKAAIFTEVSTNIFVVTFETQADKLRVSEGRPWLFDSHLIALKMFDGLTPPQGMVFDHASFWVRMHSLPLSYMTKARGEQIGGTVGRVEEVVTQDDGSGWGNFLRVQINLNITQPLDRGRTIMVKGKEMWIPFSYEKLPRFCFSCGCIVHREECCSNIYGKEEGEEQYGSWMRASSGPQGRFYTNNRTESERKNKGKYGEEVGKEEKGGLKKR